jgi:hypothetical protein
MTKTSRILSFLLLAALVLLPVRSAAARDIHMDGQVVFGQSFTLASGETMDGDLIVLFGSATIEAGAVINGDLVGTQSSVIIDGEVNGEVSILGGSLVLGDAAHIRGGLSVVDAPLDRAAGARVDGQVNEANLHFGDGQNGVLPVEPVTPESPQILRPLFNLDLTPLRDAFGNAFGLALLAMLLMLFLAPHAERVAQAAVAQPVIAGGIGLLTFFLAPFAIVLLAVSLILLPVAVVALLALIIGAVFGWISLGYEIGQRFTHAIHQEWHPAFSAGLGTFALSLAGAALTGIPVLNCIGWLVPAILGLASLGAVIMTRFGTQRIAAPAAAPAPAAAAPVTPAPVFPEPPAETVVKKRGRKVS